MLKVVPGQTLDLVSLEPEYTQDPYPLYARLRHESPVRKVVLEDLELWLVTRYEDVKKGMADSRFSTNPANAGPAARAVPWANAGDASRLAARHILRTDAPDHTRLRKLVSKAFTARHTEQLRPRIAQIAQELIAGFRDRGRADVIADFALPLPLTVIAEFLGVPAGPDRENFVRWANTYTGVEQGDAAKASQALAAMRVYLSDLIDDRRTHPPADPQNGTLLDGLIAAREEGTRLDHEELMAMVFLLLVAGYETTANLIGNGVLALLRNPDQLAMLRAQPTLIGSAVDELLRYDGPLKASGVIRHATADIALGGVVIPAGDAVLFSLLSANRDPEHFTDADHLQVGRKVNQHMAFGHGIHYCVGAPLARAEAEIAIPALLAACPGLALDVDEPAWRHSRLLRGLKQLPVTFHTARVPAQVRRR